MLRAVAPAWSHVVRASRSLRPSNQVVDRRVRLVSRDKAGPMRIPNHLALVALMVLLVAAASPARGQAASAPEVLVDVGEGIYHFRVGDRAGYDTAIKLLSSALEKEPNAPVALLFRALSFGGLGLLERDVKLRAGNEILDLEKLLEIREDPRKLQEIDDEIGVLTPPVLGETDDPTRRVLEGSRLGALTRLKNLIVREADASDEELEEVVRSAREEWYEAGNLEREAYRAMTRDLERLISVLDEPGVVIHLLKVIAQSKVARNDEDEAHGVRSGYVSPEAASGPVHALRSSAADILKQTAAALETLRPGLTGEDAVRTSFFLGVLRYRLGVPRRTTDEPADINYRVLRQAEDIMLELANDAQVKETWRSYAALYLGLIVPFRSTLELDDERRLAILDEAEEWLYQAARLDTKTPEGEDPGSASNGQIPTVVWRQREQIKRLKKQAPGAPSRWNDIQLSLLFGAHRDTNVVLLGERTDLARDISREKDYGFTSGVVFDYTLTLADRWTVGLQGRVSSLWHADVDEFDEQRYGGSVAIQYEAVRQEGHFGPVHLRLQYDYDYTLLGRSAFLESQAISPNVRIYWADRRAETNVYMTYELRDYREPLFDRRFNRDGEYLAFGIVQSYRAVDMAAKYESWGLEPWGASGDESFSQDDPFYPARYLTPFIGLRYARDGTDGEEFDQREYTLSVGATAPLPWGLELDTTAEFQWQEYSHGSLVDFHRRPRRDFIQRYLIGLSRTFVLREGQQINRSQPPIDRVLMTLRAHADFTFDDSNVKDRLGQSIFEYDRIMYGVTVAFTFN